MQSSGNYFATGADDVQGSLLSTFALPLSMEDDPEACSAPTSAVDSSSLNGIESLMGGGQYGSAYPGAYNYPDPLQNSLVSGQLHDYEKDKRSDQMKLTFIMDSGVSGSRTAFMGAADVTVPITPADIPTPKTENFLASLFPPQLMSTDLPHPLSAPLSSPLPSLSMQMSVPLSANLTVPRVLSNSTVTEPASLVPNRSNKRMQSCSACGLDFSMKSKALYHMYMHHPQAAPSKVYPCSSCENAFARKSDMTKHYDCVHLRLRPSKCLLCSSAFFFRKDLAKHIKTVHEKRRDYMCHILSCQRRFGKREHLKRHMIALHKTDRMLALPPKEPPRKTIGSIEILQVKQ